MSAKGRRVPSIKKAMEVFAEAAKIERLKNSVPCQSSEYNVLNGTARVCAAAGLNLDSPVSALTRKRINKGVVRLLEQGLSRVTVWAYVWQLRGLFAKWCRPYYRERGWRFAPLEVPKIKIRIVPYTRPSNEVLLRLRAWYGKLKGAKWFAVTMMLEFAMRNGDVDRVDDGYFVEIEGRHYLRYTPHKTALTSGRRVCWPVHDKIWRRIAESGLDALRPDYLTWLEIARDLRGLGFNGKKCAYELRKICIDHIYQRFGAEMAVSISGDDIKTISRYYADVARPNIGDVRVCDLIGGVA